MMRSTTCVRERHVQVVQKHVQVVPLVLNPGAKFRLITQPQLSTLRGSWGVLEEALKEHFSSDGTQYISTTRAYRLLNSVLDAWIKAGSFGTNDPDIKRTNDGKPMGFKVAYLQVLRAVCTENKRHA